MRTQITLAADAKTLDALARFLEEFEKLNPEPLVLCNQSFYKAPSAV